MAKKSKNVIEIGKDVSWAPLDYISGMSASKDGDPRTPPSTIHEIDAWYAGYDGINYKDLTPAIYKECVRMDTQSFKSFNDTVKMLEKLYEGL